MNWSILSRLLFVVPLILFSSFDSYAQKKEDRAPADIIIGAMSTDSGNTAVRFAMEFLDDFPLTETVFSTCGPKSPNQTPCDPAVYQWTSRISPHIDIQGGAEDAFDGVVLKMSALILGANVKLKDELDPATFKPTGEKFVGMDLDKSHHVFPVSFGLETTREFDFATL